MWHKKKDKKDAYDIIGDSNWAKYSSGYISVTSSSGVTIVVSNSNKSLLPPSHNKSKKSNKSN